MSKKTLIIVGIIIGLLIIGGSVFAYSNNQTEKQVTIDSKTEDNVTIENDEDVMVTDNTNSNNGSYITLAEYDSDSAKYNDTKVVYFFHASWCPICRSIDEDLLADMPQIPEGVTIVKTDFDNSTDLRKKYGVTNQYTFVQVDNNGNETSQWSATSSTDAIAGIKS
jgi:thiol-disulfide isomerase/thioredoxin